MSVKELKLVDTIETKFIISFENGELKIELEQGENVVWLDRNQADMLRLYLTEHLK